MYAQLTENKDIRDFCEKVEILKGQYEISETEEKLDILEREVENVVNDYFHLNKEI